MEDLFKDIVSYPEFYAHATDAADLNALSLRVLNQYCGACGDGVVDPDGADDIVGTADDEVCDDGLSNGTSTSVCSHACRLPVCGDGLVNSLTEQCDDGNARENDTCTSNCKLNYCGDGVVNTSLTQDGYPVEQCDAGGRNGTA